MKNYRCLFLWITIALALPITIGGCSGGGGGSDGGDDGLTYSGLTSAVEISELNAEDISGGAFGAGLIGDGMIALSLEEGLNDTYVTKFRSVKIPNMLSDSLHYIDFAAASTGGAGAALATVSDTQNGNCGGSMSYSVSVNSLNGSFSGNFSFENYCNDGTTIDGKARFDGTMDWETEEFLEAYFSFENLSGGGLKLDGEIEVDFAASPKVITFNAYAQDPSSQKVYWIRDYRITIDENSGYIQIEMVGRFYHPDYGYVSLSTTDPFVLHEGDEWPTSGTLIVEGANSAKAKITVIDNLSCTVAADVDGDDSYEWVSDTLMWNDI